MPSGKPQVIVRVSVAQKEAWESAARQSRMTLAGFIRRAVDLAVGSEVVAPVIRPEPDFVDETIARIDQPGNPSATTGAESVIRVPADVPAALDRLPDAHFRPDPKPSSQKKGRK